MGVVINTREKVRFKGKMGEGWRFLTLETTISKHLLKTADLEKKEGPCKSRKQGRCCLQKRR